MDGCGVEIRPWQPRELPLQLRDPDTFVCGVCRRRQSKTATVRVLSADGKKQSRRPFSPVCAM